MPLTLVVSGPRDRFLFGNTGNIMGTARYAAILLFAMRFVNGKSGLNLPFKGKYLSKSVG